VALPAFVPPSPPPPPRGASLVMPHHSMHGAVVWVCEVPSGVRGGGGGIVNCTCRGSLCSLLCDVLRVQPSTPRVESK
jgi:hypothetical protein